MEDTDLHGVPLKKQIRTPRAPTSERRPSAAERKREELTPRQQATARFWEHTAPPAEELERQWRHRVWMQKRALVARSLESTGHTQAQLWNFENCGSCCSVQWSESLQRRRLTAYFCKCRHCEPCARSKANRIAANLKDQLKDGSRFAFRLITLTLKHSETPLSDQIDRLYRCFKKLRAEKAWRGTQEGGAAILEVKLSKTIDSTGKRFWHPHIHIVAQGGFLNEDTLGRLWHKVTGDSYIVDVELMKDVKEAAHYVCKYVTKSTSDEVWRNPSAAQEWILASKSRRSCFTYGSWRKYPLTRAKQTATDWKFEATLRDIITRAKSGELVATHILNDLRKHGGGLDVNQAAALLPAAQAAFCVDDLPAPAG